ncbi:MAG: 5'-nucleotidase, lipoprotein e(P4) family [Planctomycetes bacterium]|nr:5'-nucleotidase, lipoprotein e(P4) family [Planctomycetota bacterium]
MRTETCLLRVSLVVVLALTGCVASRRAPHRIGDSATLRPSAAAPPVVDAEVEGSRVTAHDGLNATLWMQSAVEYQASARQAYAAAGQMMEEALQDASWTAALEQQEQADYARLPPAVILDLDETVLDSSPYMARLVRDDVGYSDATWKAWVGEAAAQAIPGALEFTRAAAARGVRVIYLTNRDADEEAATRINLERLGFPLGDDPDDVLTQGEIPEWSPRDKGPRRAYVARSHRILLLIGDNLTDFLSDDRADMAGRSALFAQHEARWGRSWIVVPNPLYGSWEAAAYGGNYGLSPEARRAAKRALLRTR